MIDDFYHEGVLDIGGDMLSSSISVVIPAYNAESFIEDALDSINSQTLLPSEVIIVNDGSVDNTTELIERWIAHHSPIYPINLHSQKNRGISGARNEGIKIAKSHWIALLDADDIFEPNHLEELSNVVSKFPKVVAAYGAGRVFSNNFIHDLRYDDFWDNPSQSFGIKIDDTELLRINNSIFPRLIKGNFIKPSSLIFLRNLALDIGLFNERLIAAEDREFLVRLIRKGDFIYTPVAITRYRWHENNATQTKNSKRNSENGLMALKVVRENKDLNLGPDEIESCNDVIRTAVHEYLYIASQAGVFEYLKSIKFINVNFKSINSLPGLNVKDFIRSLRATLI